LVSRANSLKYNPQLRALLYFAKAAQFAEYAMLIAGADATGHYGVGIFLESLLADRLAFLERSRHLVRHNHLQARWRNVWRRETS